MLQNTTICYWTGVSRETISMGLIFRKRQIETCRFIYVCVTAVTKAGAAWRSKGLRGLRELG